jgi:putative nucleotidyltransferase with HDIG domain
MLAYRTDHAAKFTRRDLIRLCVASVLLIVTLTATLAIDIAPGGLGLKVGTVADASIRAPRAIQYVSQINTDRAKSNARDGVPPQYDYSPERAANIATQQAAAFGNAVANADAAFSSSLNAINRQDLLRSTLPGLSPAAHDTLDTLSPERWQVIRREALRVLSELEQTQLRDTDVATQLQFLGNRVEAGLGADERELAVELISPFVLANSSYSDTLTQQARDQAAASVEPVTQSYQKGQVIVDQGHIITAVDLEAIDALGLNESHVDTAQLAGWFLLSALLVGLLLAWVWRFRPELWHRNNVLLLVGLMLALATVALKVTAGRELLPFFVPTAAVGMLLAILLDAGAATVLMAVLAILGGAVNGSSLELASFVFLGGLAGIVGVRRGDRLHVFVQAGFAVALVNIAVVSTFVLLGERDLDLTGVLQLWAASVASGAGAAVATVGSFAALGNLFGILTVFQLLELANPSQAVLRRLLTETPGTYHHSLMVGNLAERAAEAVGADPLLARTAAYYHDIGKLNNPLAFIENQAGGENIHDELPPEVSAQVLKAHVADGIDVAYRSRLPKALISFIPQHHGTALMSYFYAKAKEEAAAPFGGVTTTDGAKAADTVDARRFRHAGPKPQSREAAILMLADSVEASVRSLSSRDEATIRAMVSRIIEERLKDGQFDECDLTLRDIERIREAFVSQLLGMYHQRIAYPQNKVVELESRRGTGAGAGA